MKPLLVTLGFTLAGFSVWLLVTSYGSARYREGIAVTVNAQTKTDNAALLQSAKTMADAYQQVATSLGELAPDPLPVPASVGATISKLCKQREQSGVPCVSAGPSKPPVQGSGGE